jgi:hemerythrin-like metal-binding protein
MKGADLLAKHHRKINNLLADIEKIKAQEKPQLNEIMQCFHKLSYISVNYITEEEILLSRSKYPKLEVHKKEHQAFINKLPALHSECQNKPKESLEALYQILQEWKSKHIEGPDKELMQFLSTEEKE